MKHHHVDCVNNTASRWWIGLLPTDILLLIIHIKCVLFPQIRFVMKSYSFIRETAPLVMKNPPKEGTNVSTNVRESYGIWIISLSCLFLLRRKSQIPIVVQLPVLPLLPNVDLQGVISSVGFHVTHTRTPSVCVSLPHIDHLIPKNVSAADTNQSGFDGGMWKKLGVFIPNVRCN